jgi:hypothetical protein
VEASKVEPPTEESESSADDLLEKMDHILDPEREDKRALERMKNPFIRWAFVSLIALLFLIFGTYFISFIYQIPLPESKLLEHFMNVIVEVMKILVP